LIEAGIVVPEGKKYTLRTDNLSSVIDEIEKDISRTCEELKSLAEDIDKDIGL